MNTPILRYLHTPIPRTMYRLATLITTLFLLAPSAFTQATRYVATDGEDSTECTDEANPCATIGYTLDQATDGDAIEIADGEYTEMLDITKNIALHGESEEGTIIQAHEEPGEADGRVITIQGAREEEDRLEVEITGVTIRHGVASGDLPNNCGGGIYNGGGDFGTSYGATLTLTNTTISGNTASSGGGIWFALAFYRFTDVTFSENSAEGTGGGMFNSNSSASSLLTNVAFSGNSVTVFGLGGGMFNSRSSPTLTEVTFSDNESYACGGIYNSQGSPTLTSVAFIGNSANNTSGGGFCNSDGSLGVASPMLSDVSFIENTARVGGGGIFNWTDETGSTPVFTNVTFDENSAEEGGGMFTSGTMTLTNATFTENTAGTFGGGLHSYGGATGSFPVLTNIVFNGNTATSGGALASTTTSSGNLSSPILTNVTLSGNHAFNGGGIHNSSYSRYIFGEIELTNTILWGNTADKSGNEIFNADTSSVFLSFSLYGNGDGDIVEGGGFVAENSLTADPLFVDIENGDLSLQGESPAIDTGHPGTPEDIFATDENGDPIDLDGNSRFFGDVIDIGAYENQGTIADEAIPEELAEGLTLPAPNPVREVATLTVAVEESQDVTVEVFDVTGRRVQTLYDSALAAGTSETLTLDASELPAGVYVIRATGSDFVETQGVTVVR